MKDFLMACTIVLIWVAILGIGLFTYNNLLEQRMKRESYISGLLDTYNRDLQGCTEAVKEEKKKKATEKLIRETCTDPINKSRTAKLLRDWGYEGLLTK